MRRRLPPAWLLALAAALAGVALVAFVTALIVDRDEPRVSGSAREAVAVVQALERAIVAKDFARVCDELYTIEAREAAGGDECQSVLKQATANLRRPRITLRSLAVIGPAATVEVVAEADGRPAAADTIRLVRQRGRFRIASAGPPSPRGR